MVDEQELVDYDSTDDTQETKDKSVKRKDSHVSHNFNDFNLKCEILRATIESGFEHPSEVQRQVIPKAIRGTDVLYQAKAGMGKTSAYIISTLQQLKPIDGQVSILLLCLTRELAYSISRQYERLSKYQSNVKISVFFGGVPIKTNQDVLKNNCPHIVVGTCGRILALAKMKALDLHHIKHFIIDDFDQILQTIDIRRDVIEIFKMTPHEKQVIMCSSTLDGKLRTVCKKFMQDPVEITMNDGIKSILNNFCHYYVQLTDVEKEKTLFNLLDKLDFKQVIIFVHSILNCSYVYNVLMENNFPAVEIHSNLPQEERLKRCKEFQEFRTRILVTTNLLAHGINFEHVNIVFNYNIPDNNDSYLHRASRLGGFGSKGLVVTFVTNQDEINFINRVASNFRLNIDEMPDKVDVSTYM